MLPSPMMACCTCLTEIIRAVLVDHYAAAVCVSLGALGAWSLALVVEGFVQCLRERDSPKKC